MSISVPKRQDHSWTEHEFFITVLDATAKIPSGLLQGNGIQLGDFDQCVESRARVKLDTGSVVKVQGKYCLARIDLKADHPELEGPVYLAQAKSLIRSKIDDVSCSFLEQLHWITWIIGSYNYVPLFAYSPWLKCITYKTRIDSYIVLLLCGLVLILIILLWFPNTAIAINNGRNTRAIVIFNRNKNLNNKMYQ